MNVIKLKLYKAVIIVVLAIAVPAFAAGWIVAVNFSGVFETGYKVAFLDIKSSMKEARIDGQPFFVLNGLRFMVAPETCCNNTVEVVVSNAH